MSLILQGKVLHYILSNSGSSAPLCNLESREGLYTMSLVLHGGAYTMSLVLQGGALHFLTNDTWMSPTLYHLCYREQGRTVHFVTSATMRSLTFFTRTTGRSPILCHSCNREEPYICHQCNQEDPNNMSLVTHEGGLHFVTNNPGRIPTQFH